MSDANQTLMSRVGTTTSPLYTSPASSSGSRPERVITVVLQPPVGPRTRANGSFPSLDVSDRLEVARRFSARVVRVSISSGGPSATCFRFIRA